MKAKLPLDACIERFLQSDSNDYLLARNVLHETLYKVYFASICCCSDKLSNNGFYCEGLYTSTVQTS